MKPKRYTVLVGDVTILTTNSREEAYNHKAWLKMKLPKAPVEVKDLVWKG